ncbi:MAG: right-handed parallel beta-helix repeat-containing protein [Candidatus Brockarchaeota archaeon]|nr:right-handed parallel beta-helix repeat-containing protein [Candidatus Brockarchaeota archaeon]
MKRIFAVVLILLTLSVLIPFFSVKAGWSGRTIWIRADGTVEPGDAPVRREGDTYFLTGDVEASADGIVVQKDNVVIDGGNHLLKGMVGGYDGVYLDGRSGVTVRNLRIQWFQIGFSLWNSNGNELNGNIVENSEIGIYLDNSSNNRVFGNRLSGCGLYVWDSYGNVVTDNTVNGQPLVYLEGESSKRISDAGQVVLVKCGNIVVENLNVFNATIGVELFKTDNSVVRNSRIRNSVEYGISICSSSGNELEGNIVENSGAGISLWNSSNNKVTGNIVENASDGVYLASSSNRNQLTENRFVNCGLRVSDSYDNIVADNTVNNKALIYLEGESGRIIRDAGQVILVKCSSIVVENLNVFNATIGVELFKTNNSVVKNNNIGSMARAGVYIYKSMGNRMVGNNAEKNGYGIYLRDSFNNEVAENILENNAVGIVLTSSSENNITGNDVKNNTRAIYLSSSSSNKLAGNIVRNSIALGIFLISSSSNKIFENIVENNMHGIYLDRSSTNNEVSGNILVGNGRGIFLRGSSSNNKFYRNDFVSNKLQIDSYKCVNTWDDGSKGNYWSDYTGVDSDKDGVGDIPYVIDENNKDNFPSMKPYFSLFIVNVSTPYGIAKGSGRYKGGSVATVSISQVVIDHGNGTRRVFKGWFEDSSLISVEQSFSITVDKSRVIFAEWGKEYEVEAYSDWGTVTGSEWYGAGETATISIGQTLIDHGNGTRRVFKGWFEDGSLAGSEQVLKVTVNEPKRIVVRWDTEYEVTVSSETGSVAGSGWYAVGETATVSISLTQTGKDFLANHVFEGWRIDGNIVSTSPTYSFIVEKPVKLVASWRTEISIVAVGLIAGVPLIVVLLAVLMLRRRRAALPPRHP